jgi:hypothetical protein
MKSVMLKEESKTLDSANVKSQQTFARTVPMSIETRQRKIFVERGMTC